MNVAITLHGTTRDFKVPVQINATADEIQANGRMALSQTDFGIVPYSILNGAIQVQDELNLRFVIVARRVER
jgi:polyisoprenoid-binding protein YceI